MLIFELFRPFVDDLKTINQEVAFVDDFTRL